MRIVMFFLFHFIFCTANAANYFVSNSGDDNNSGTTTDAAWKTLVKVQIAGNSGIIKAGDCILFKKGETFTGILKWTTIWGQHCASGTALQPITFAGYGNGANPIFYYPVADKAIAENRVLMLFSGVDYIVIDGLDFTDNDRRNDKITSANCGIPIYLGTIGEATTNYCNIKNVNISFCGMGLVIVGDHNTLRYSNLTDFKNLKSTPNTGGSSAYEDYGANAITITGNDNEISHNYINGAWAESMDFGWNGGACEMYNNCSRNKLLYNTIVDCGGVAEFGAQQAGAISADNLFSFNKIINCGTLTYCNLSGEFAVQAYNVQYFYNTIVENSDSRFSGPNTGRGITSPGPLSIIKPDSELFAYNGKSEADIVFNLRNNIFLLSTGIAIARKSNDPLKYSHEKNVYRLLSGSVTPYALNESELMATGPVFQNTNATDPQLWNYQPTHETKGIIAGADAKPFSAGIQALLAIISIDAIFEFISGDKKLNFDLSKNSIIATINILFKLAEIFLNCTQPFIIFDRAA